MIAPYRGPRRDPRKDWHAGPVADQAAFRIDFPVWLTTISRRNRRIVEKLAVGCSSKEVARRHRLSKSRVAHIRRELRQSWNEFQHESETDA